MLLRLVTATLLYLISTSVVNAQLTMPSTQCVTSVEAGGTGDALTVPLLPCFPTTNLLVLLLTATNTTTAPTLEVTGSGVAAQTILNASGSALTIGQLPSGKRVILTYDGTNWFLLN